MAEDHTETFPPKERGFTYYDDPSQMTKGRKLALKWEKKKRWYNPRVKKSMNKKGKDDEDAMTHFQDNNENGVEVALDEANNGKTSPPSLEKAWEYFEHIILPRCYVENPKPEDYTIPIQDGDTTGDKIPKGQNLLRAEPGEHERPTKLYPVFGTNDEDMGDFGIGIGLYFNTLKFLSILFLIVGLINIPNMVYYASDSYEGNGAGIDMPLPSWGLRTSAVCRNVEWQPCPACNQTDFNRFPSTDISLAYGENTQGDKLTFIRKNNCNINDRFSIITYVSMIIVILAIYYLMFDQHKKIVFFDESQSTTKDYSIEITNPPNDARNPEDWKTFFESNFDNVHVRACTIALENEELVQALIRRRKHILKLINMAPTNEGVDHDDLNELVASCPNVPTWRKVLFFASDPNDIYDSIKKEDLNIQELSKKEYDVSSVFVTFETEHSQREVLKVLSHPILSIPHMQEKYKFNGVTLHVSTTEEPDAIRWQDLNVPMRKRIIQLVKTSLVTLILIAGGALIITALRMQSASLASTAIAIFNQITPRVVRVLTSFEYHPGQSSYSASNYIKMTLFRWINTAVIYSIINPFTQTIANGSYLIDSVLTMFLFDLVLTPSLGLSDLVGNFMRHFLGPRAATQRRMNLCFKASTYDIGELYTNVTRIFFFTLFYCTLFPAGFLFASVIFFSAYWVDRFCILRSWCQSPQVGPAVSIFTNNFFLLSLIAYTILAAYQFATFPFDHACASGDDINNYVGNYYLTINDGSTLEYQVTAADAVYKFCKQQDLFRSGVFPPITSFSQQEDTSWMNSSQEKFSPLFGWTMVTTLTFVIVSLISRIAFRIYRVLCCQRYELRGEPTKEKFSELNDVVGYIPQVNVPGYEFPFLLCDIDIIAPDLLGWRDPTNSYDFWNLIYDIPYVAERKRQQRELITNDDKDMNRSSFEISAKTAAVFAKQNAKLFSIVKDWELGSNKK